MVLLRKIHVSMTQVKLILKYLPKLRWKYSVLSTTVFIIITMTKELQNSKVNTLKFTHTK